MKVARIVRKAPLKDWEDDSETVEIVGLADLPKPKQPEMYRGTDELIAKSADDEVSRWSLFWPLIKEIRLARLAHIDFGEVPISPFGPNF